MHIFGAVTMMEAKTALGISSPSLVRTKDEVVRVLWLIGKLPTKLLPNWGDRPFRNGGVGLIGPRIPVRWSVRLLGLPLSCDWRGLETPLICTNTTPTASLNFEMLDFHQTQTMEQSHDPRRQLTCLLFQLPLSSWLNRGIHNNRGTL
jgi:hypothetical protein